MSAIEHEPSDRIARLRAAVLTGRGPGASEREIADHTRNRPWLGAVPAPVERIMVSGQAEAVRAGEPLASHRAGSEVWYSKRRAALIGAVVALSARSIGMRLIKARSPHRR